jgi:hypothetical protein
LGRFDHALAAVTHLFNQFAPAQRLAIVTANFRVTVTHLIRTLVSSHNRRYRQNSQRITNLISSHSERDVRIKAAAFSQESSQAAAPATLVAEPCRIVRHYDHLLSFCAA